MMDESLMENTYETMLYTEYDFNDSVVFSKNSTQLPIDFNDLIKNIIDADHVNMQMPAARQFCNAFEPGTFKTTFYWIDLFVYIYLINNYTRFVCGIWSKSIAS